jgi:1,4-alpha-glucan branching enzyme
MQTPTLIEKDPWLKPFEEKLITRQHHALQMEKELTGGQALKDFANGHLYFGTQLEGNKLYFREWAPNAEKIYLIGDFSGWKNEESYAFSRAENGVWELSLDMNSIRHGDLYRLSVHWNGGRGDRIPAYARRVVQDKDTYIFNAQLWIPPEPYRWINPVPDLSGQCLLYTRHISAWPPKSMKTGTFMNSGSRYCRYIYGAGYNAIQLMAIQEHPYYGSFGYHVSNFSPFLPASAHPMS